MSRGGRGDLIAIGLAGLLAATLAYWIFDEASLSETFYEQQASEAAQAARNSSAEHIERVCTSRTTFLECQADEHEAARERERNERDLQAQLVTSAWTRAMGLAALIATFVGIVGVGLVLATFRETKKQVQIMLAQTGAKIRMTPTLSVSSHQGVPYPQEFSMQVINEGPTEARNVQVTSFVISTSDGSFTNLSLHTKPRGDAVRDVAGGGSGNGFPFVHPDFLLDWEKVRNDSYKGLEIEAEAKLVYQDIVGTKGEESARWRGRFTNMRDDGGFIVGQNWNFYRTG